MPLGGVVASPAFDQDAGFGQSVEDLAIRQSVALRPVEGFAYDADAVLSGPSNPTERAEIPRVMQPGAISSRPRQSRVELIILRSVDLSRGLAVSRSRTLHQNTLNTSASGNRTTEKPVCWAFLEGAGHFDEESVPVSRGPKQSGSDQLIA